MDLFGLLDSGGPSLRLIMTFLHVRCDSDFTSCTRELNQEVSVDQKTLLLISRIEPVDVPYIKSSNIETTDPPP